VICWKEQYPRASCAYHQKYSIIQLIRLSWLVVLGELLLYTPTTKKQKVQGGRGL
jgi:hypothetical protein